MSDAAKQPVSLTSDLDALLAIFFLAWRGFAAEPDAILEREGLGRVHHRILYAVVRIPGIRVGELAATLGVTRQAIHAPLSELLERKLVVSRVSKESARERALSITARGRLLEDRASGAQRGQLERSFKKLGRRSAEGWALVMSALAEPAMARSPGRIAEAVARRRAAQKGQDA